MTQVNFIRALLPDGSLPAESQAFVSQQVQQEAGQFVTDAQAAQSAAEAARDAAQDVAQQLPAIAEPIVEAAAAQHIAAVAATASAATAAATMMEGLGVFSTNLFNRATITQHTSVSETTGQPVASSGQNLSDWIPVIPGGTYNGNADRASGGYRIAEYDGTRQFIKISPSGQVNQNVAVTMTADTRFVRLVIRTMDLDLFRFNAGGMSLPYEPYNVGQIPQAMLDLPITYSSNLFDSDTITKGARIDTETGEVVSPWSSQNVSDWIAVLPGTTYSTNSSSGRIGVGPVPVAEYGPNKTFIKRTDTALGNSLVTTSRTRYLRLQVHDTDLPEFQLNQGVQPQPYEPYEVKLLGTPIAHRRPLLTDSKAFFDVFEGPELGDRYDLDATTTADVYSWYDALVAAHPDYVAMTELGLSSDGVTQMRQYVFKAPDVPTQSDEVGTPTAPTPVPSALLIAGGHGFEKPAVHHLWRFCKALCEEWQTDPVLDAIRWNIEVVVVPVENPYGYDNMTRHNANLVDINRNYEPGWTFEPDTNSPFYAGTAPLSEPESQIVDGVIRSVREHCVMGVSLHNFSTHDPINWRFMWQPATSDFTLDLGKQVISRMSRLWKQKHSWITNPATYYGNSSPFSGTGSVGGTTPLQMQKYGIEASNFETSHNQKLDGLNAPKHGARTMTLGYEATVNYIALAIGLGLEHRR